MQPLSLHVPHRVFGMATSGNCHKVKLALDLLRIPYRWHETDIMQGESRTPEFPFSRKGSEEIPVPEPTSAIVHEDSSPTSRRRSGINSFG